jgi:hypothetical protein
MVPRPLPANHRYTRPLSTSQPLVQVYPRLGSIVLRPLPANHRYTRPLSTSQPLVQVYPRLGSCMVLMPLPANHRCARLLFYQPTIGTGLSKIREHAWFRGLSQPTIGIPDLSSTRQPLVQFYPRLGSCMVPRPLPTNHPYTRPLFYQPTIGTGLSKIRELHGFQAYPNQPSIYQTSLLPANHWYRSIQD